MSLINDALKKAQKMRMQDQAALAPALPNGNSGPVAKRSRPMPTQLLAGIVAGAAVLVAASVLATVFWLRKPGVTPAPKPVAPPSLVSESPPPTPAAPPIGKVEPAPASVLTIAAPAPVAVVAPPAAASGTARVAPPTETHPAAATAPAESTLPSPTDLPGVAPVGSGHTPAVTDAVIRPAALPKHDPRAQAFVDALRVAGIRSSGGDSKVLMNDRVFRVNDIVERSLGLRLTGVAADQLTFTDESGVVYTRNF